MRNRNAHRAPRFALALVALLALVTTTLALPSSEAEAHPRSGGPFGLGVILFEPTGVTGKYFIDNLMAIDFHVGVQGLDNGREDDVGFYADFLFNFEVASFNWASLALYIGPGLALILDDDDRYCTRFRCYDDTDDDVHVAIRAPFGLAFWFASFNGEAFIELTSSLFVTPHTDFDLDLATGFRYYF